MAEHRAKFQFSESSKKKRLSCPRNVHVLSPSRRPWNCLEEQRLNNKMEWRSKPWGIFWTEKGEPSLRGNKNLLLQCYDILIACMYLRQTKGQIVGFRARVHEETNLQFLRHGARDLFGAQHDVIVKEAVVGV